MSLALEVMEQHGQSGMNEITTQKSSIYNIIYLKYILIFIDINNLIE